jgi:hypothetical protein
VPASDRTGAGMRRHLRAGHGAAESFVSCIRLFGSSVIPAMRASSLACNASGDTRAMATTLARHLWATVLG